MTEALIAELAKIVSLRVISRTSAMRYKDRQNSLPEIAAELGADVIVEGSVLRADDRIRITVELIEAASDSHLWAESYERDLRDILRLQSEVARAIASQIQVKLTLEDKVRLNSGRQVNPEAYDLYLRARFHWHKRTEEELRKGIGHFRHAVERDQGCAEAYSGLADSYIILNVRGYASPKETNENAMMAARRALEIDDKLAEAHASLARALMNNWEWSSSESEFQRAIELNPGYAETHHGYSHFLIAMGRVGESLVESKRALLSAPLDIMMGEHLAWHYLMARELDAAIDMSHKMLELDPDGMLAHYHLGIAYEAKSMYSEAIAEFQTTVRLSNVLPEPLVSLAHCYAMTGETAKALAILDQLVVMSGQRYVSPVYMSVITSGLGNRGQALAWLKKAYDERSAMLVYLRVEPRFDPLRSDSRFHDLLRRMNFPP